MGRLGSLATIAASLLAAGCGGGGGGGSVEDEALPAAAVPRQAQRLPEVEVRRPAATAPAGMAEVPAGFRFRRLSESGMQIALPRGWVALARRDAVFPGAAQTLLRIDGSLRPELAALSLPDSPLKLLVLAPSRGGRFPATVSVVVSAAGRAPAVFAEWAPDVRRALVATAKPVGGRVASRRVRLAVGDGLRMVFEQQRAGRRVAVIQYAAMADGQAFLVRLTTTPRLLRTVVRDFDALAVTLGGLPGSSPAAPPPASGSPLAPAA